MSSLALRAAFEPLRSLAFGSIGAAYMGVGAAFSHPIRMLIIENLTNAELLFSFNGIDDHLALPSGGPIIFDFTTNKGGNSQGFFIAEGDRVYVKESGTPTSGTVYVSVVYGRE